MDTKTNSFDSKSTITDFKFSYKWEIPNLRKKKIPVGECLTSNFNFNSNCNLVQNELLVCQICLYPQGVNEENKHFVAIKLNLIHNEPSKLDFTVSILNSINEKTNEWNKNSFKGTNLNFEIREFIRRDSLLNPQCGYLQKETLIILIDFKTESNIVINDIETNFKIQWVNELEKLFNNPKFSDLKFQVTGGDIIYAHKNILAHQSAVFAVQFERDVKGNSNDTIEINDISYEAFKEMLRYMYCGKIDEVKLTKYNKVLLNAANKYAINSLKLQCQRSLCKNICIDNTIELLELSDIYDAEKLREDAIKFIVSNGRHFVNSGKLPLVANLNPKIVADIMKALVLK